MKTLLSLLSVVLLSLVMVATVALAADPAVPAAVTAIATADASSTTWIAAILGVLLALSEMLALIPSVKANGLFDALYKGLKAIAGKGGQ